jgi:AcrR family transcriptional regulator
MIDRAQLRSPIRVKRRRAKLGVAAGISKGSILRIAAEEFALRGYESTNLGRVAIRLGVTRQALYHHFARKADILVALFESHFDDLESELAEATVGDEPGQQFEDMLRRLGGFTIARPWMSRIFAREDGRLPRRARTALDKRRRLLQARLVRAYKEGVRAGRLRKLEPNLAVSLDIGAIAWMHRWFRAGRGLSADEMADFVTDILLKGVASRPSR